MKYVLIEQPGFKEWYLENIETYKTQTSEELIDRYNSSEKPGIVNVMPKQLCLSCCGTKKETVLGEPYHTQRKHDSEPYREIGDSRSGFGLYRRWRGCFFLLKNKLSVDK